MTKYFPDLCAEYEQLLDKMRADGITSGSMYNEVKDAIEWMRTGYDPVIYRMENRNYTFATDPWTMEQIVAHIEAEHLHYETEFEIEVELLPEHRETIGQALKGLIEREKIAFIAIRAARLPFSKAANLLGLSKGTVQVQVRRAEQKIRANVSQIEGFVL